VRVRHRPEGNGARVAVEIDYRLAGYWVERDRRDLIERIDLPDGRILDQPGLPRVPAAVFSIALPFGARFSPTEVEVTVDESFCASGQIGLGVVPQPRLDGNANDAPDLGSFAADDWFPSVVAEVCPAPALDGIARAVVRVNPLAVSLSAGRLQVRAAVHVQVVCAVPKQGRHDPAQLGIDSPLWRGLVGIDQLGL